jgi:transposase
MLQTRRCLDVNVEELQQELDRKRPALGEEAYAKLCTALEALRYLEELVADKDMTMAELRRLIVVHGGTEKTREVLQRVGLEGERLRPAPPAAGAPDTAAPRAPVPGHGRTPAAAYTGARRIVVPHETLRHGDRCPECGRGKVFVQREPKRQIRFGGQAPVMATVYERERLRCNACNQVFTAVAPTGVGDEKYDPTAASTIAQLKYGSGVPFHRLAGLQARHGIPLPESTQCEIVQEVAGQLAPVLDELIRQAAQGEVLHNDDTKATILALQHAPPAGAAPDTTRTGTFTSAIVARAAGHKIALYFTGRKHAGENLAAVLAHRAAELAPPIQVCDALARNLPKPLAVILANCLAHGRRQFVEIAPNFPAECKYVLETLAEVYRFDEQAREQALSPENRLRFHQTHSGPVMTDLHDWLTAQLDEKRAEPNSGLGRAIRYLLNHWEPLTLFLRQPGVPLDNNLCERALRKAILNRKNALFYKTANGARAGDLFMSLIHTCELCGVDSFDYLTELQRHAADLALTPSEWMPWNYRETLARDRGSEPEHGPAP